MKESPTKTKSYAFAIQIAYKEALETHFGIRLLHDAEYIAPDTHASMLNDCEELLRLLSASFKTLRQKCGMVGENTEFAY